MMLIVLKSVFNRFGILPCLFCLLLPPVLLAQEVTDKVLFNGNLEDKWLDLSWAGGDYVKFAQFKDNALVVNVPEGNSWGKTGIRSKDALFKIPEFGSNSAIKISFDINSKQSTDFVFAIIPANWDGVKEWRSHHIRLQVNHNSDEVSADLSLRIKTSEKMRTTVDIQRLNRIYITIRSDKVVLISDENNNILLQAVMDDYTKIYNEGYKISVLTHAKESGLPAKLNLKKISLQEVEFLNEMDYSLMTDKIGKKVIFDGNILGNTWKSFVKSKVEFDDSAILKQGALFVDVPVESSNANVGIESNQPILWLDYFGVGTKRELTFEFLPELTTGFAIALSNKGQHFIVKWFKSSESNDATIQIYLSNSLYLISSFHSSYKPVWEQKVSSIAPKQVKLLMTPQGITLSGENLPTHTQSWDKLLPFAGYDLTVYSFPELPNKAVQMALKKITLDNQVLAANQETQPKAGVEPLPIVTLFNGSQHENWEYNPWKLPESSNVLCGFNAEGFEVKDLEKKSPSSTCGINYKDKIIILDERIDNANYKVTVQFDPNKTKNFGIVWSHQKDRHNWDYCELSLLQTENKEDKLHLRCPGIIQRTVDSEWLKSSWNGQVNLTFSKDYFQVGLNNGPTILYNSSPPKKQYLYIMAPHYRYRDTIEKMQLTKVTGQWQPLKPIDSVERWIFLDKKDFDPEQFLQDLANDLPYPNTKVTVGDENEK